MTKENGVKVLTDMVADFVAHIGKKLPDDVVEKLEELGSQESAALPKVLYETMTKNQGLAVELNRPSCQDTGVLQFWLKCGTNFPYINELEALLKEAVVQATFAAPLRHNSVETFDEYNTKKTLEKELRLYGGTSFQIVINVRFTHTWQEADVLFREKQWYLCQVQDTKVLPISFLTR